jgi:hypothetical protein
MWLAIPRGPFSLKTVELCGAKCEVFHTPSIRSPDRQRTLLNVVYQHRPNLAELIARLISYHSDGS